MRKLNLLLTCTCAFLSLSLQAQKKFLLSSPDGKLTSRIEVGDRLTYDISHSGEQVLSPSPISIKTDQGKTWGEKARLSKVSRRSNDTQVNSPFYRSSQVRDYYNEITLRFKGDYSVVFRAYNDGIAYRFENHSPKTFCILHEEASYQFPTDATATVPYVFRGKDGDFNDQFFSSFENIYATAPISQLNKQRLMFLPLVVQATPKVKVCITESDLNNYPGMYLSNAEGKNMLSAVMAPYPKTLKQGGHNELQMLVEDREDFIAKVDGKRTFPWRIAIVTDKDTQLAASNLSYLLGEPSKLTDTSWIKPGKVAWEWWNDWNLDGVDFKTGVNNATYKAYIDFAAQHGIEYVILDEGWAVNLKADLMQVVKDIDLKELTDYAKARNVGIILWAGYYAFERDMENVCRYFSELGVKGFKVDFMDRDDQMMTDFNHRAAAMCAKYKLVLDLHGTHKPAGLNRTYPNVLNFEGVHGMEQMKWRPAGFDQVTYETMLPFIRQTSGPMDYTQGAMRNANRSTYYPCNSEPMSQGTRSRQLALYVILESPLNMMCDTPSNYQREPECTEAISQIPTVWDETIVLDGKMGEYVVMARRKGDCWHVGGITNWEARTVNVDLPFLPEGSRQAVLFKDGVNADRIARDYKRESLTVGKQQPLQIHLAPGGGFLLKIQ